MTTGPGSAVAISILRGFSVSADHRIAPLVWSAQRVLAFLALRNRRLTRVSVAGALWPEAVPVRASANLRSALWRAHRSCGGVVETSPQELALGTTVAVDLHASVHQAHRLLDPHDECDDILTAAVRVDLSHDVLPGWYDDWVVNDREQYRQLRLHALDAMCERLTAAGRHGDAVQAGIAAVQAEPLRESAHRALILAHLAAGNRLEALRQYDRCRDIVLGELQMEPSAELSQLLARAGLVSAARAPGPSRRVPTR